MLGALKTDAVIPETASDGEIRVSEAIESGKKTCGGVLEFLERRVRLDSLREVLGAVRTEFVASETERLEGRVRLERFGEVLGALRAELVVIEIELFERRVDHESISEVISLR